MNHIAGIPYTEAEFDENGKPLNEPIVPAGTTDLIVVSHGWQNSREDATDLYTKLFTNLAEVTRGDPEFARRKLAILGVIWPSKQFDVAMTELQNKQHQAGGAAGTGGSDLAESERAMQLALDRSEQFFSSPPERQEIEKLRELTTRLDREPLAQREFIRILRHLADPNGSAAAMRSNEDASRKFFSGNPETIFEAVRRPIPAAFSGPKPKAMPVASAHSIGDAQGHAVGLSGSFSEVACAVCNLLNLATYYTMKNRAGTVGSKGVAMLLDRVANSVERIHLVGHSFGGRVVAAAATDSTTNKLHSLSLLQAAFSHNGFSRRKEGFFRPMIDQRRIGGPAMITHTKSDRSVGLAYPIASRISGDHQTAIGDAQDDFGGIGSNGAQNQEPGEISERVGRLLAVGAVYPFEAGKLHNLCSDNFIKDPSGGDAHGFVYVPEVGWAISRAILS